MTIKNDIVKVITTTVRMTTMVILKTMMIYIHKNSQFPEPLTYHRFGSSLKFLLKTLTEWNSFSTSSFQCALF